jgi:DNA ligase-1
MKFFTVAAAFDQIEQESSRTAITVDLAALLQKATAFEAGVIAYFSLGSLTPPYLGTQFNLAEKSLINIIATLLDKPNEAVKKELKRVGDLGSLVAHYTWGIESSVLSLVDVERLLQQVLALSGTGSQEARELAVVKILRALDPISAKYVLRIIEGNLRLGFSDMTLLDACSWMQAGDKSLRANLELAYNICADIGLIVRTLKEKGLDGIQAMVITPGIPIRPAAAERLADAAAIVKKLGPCVAQPKLDGFRVQVHLDNRTRHKTVRFFSRNLLDMSAMFPDLIASLQALDVEQLIVEGEAICIDPQTGSFLPFQETVKRKRKHNIEQVAEDFPLKLFLFDILFLDGQSLLEQSHEKRRNILLQLCNKKIIREHGVIEVVQEHRIEDATTLYNYFEETITMGLEGLVVKRPDAIYQPGKRNFNWIKLKREETGSLDDTLDCVVLGYYAGQGKRALFGIGALLVGVYNPDLDVFQTVAKIGTGFTDAEWREVKKSCDTQKVSQQPHEVVCNKELFPDVWVLPSIVCMVRADEITLSPTHTAHATATQLGYALRFPRFMGYRPDKSVTAATTSAEIEALYQLQFTKKAKK